VWPPWHPSKGAMSLASFGPLGILRSSSPSIALIDVVVSVPAPAKSLLVGGGVWVRCLARQTPVPDGVVECAYFLRGDIEGRFGPLQGPFRVTGGTPSRKHLGRGLGSEVE